MNASDVVVATATSSGLSSWVIIAYVLVFVLVIIALIYVLFNATNRDDDWQHKSDEYENNSDIKEVLKIMNKKKHYAYIHTYLLDENDFNFLFSNGWELHSVINSEEKLLFRRIDKWDGSQEKP